MTENSFYWHDYETFGVDTQRDRAVQFAGIRTDFDFNIIDKPLLVYCQPATDTLPQPEACCVTGITPQLALEKGVCEAEFIAQIHREIAQKNTCTLGYNNLRFDDEVTRNLLYRNFYDPYAREWQNGNSRWDLIDLTRTVHALRPEGIRWPIDAEGKISFRLEKLTTENGIQHSLAHDALSDVYASIALAKLIKQTHPKLFNFFLHNRGKHQSRQLLQLGSGTPVVHVSAMYGVQKQYLSLVLPVCQHPVNNNGVIVYDLSVNPETMLSLSVAEIQQRIFTAKAELPEGIERIALKTIHLNKCPIIAPVKVLRTSDVERLAINIAQCLKHRDLIQRSDKIKTTLNQVFSAYSFPADAGLDPDLMLYNGGFFSAQDKQIMHKIRTTKPDQLASFKIQGGDSRLNEMLFRYRARNYPQTLSNQESEHWRQFCLARLSNIKNNHWLDFVSYQEKLNQLKQQNEVDKQLIKDLEQYAMSLQKKLQS